MTRMNPDLDWLDLPRHTRQELEDLAADVHARPTAEQQDAITAVVKEQAAWPGRLDVSAHRVADTLRAAGVDVTAGQVAWVLLQSGR